MIIKRLSGWIGLFLLLAFSAFPSPALARAHATDPWDWIIQHVCADASDRPVPADPYDGCPPGTVMTSPNDVQT